MNPGVDKYLMDGCMRCKYGATPQCKVHRWAEELVLLRKLALEAGLNEEIKWGMPCYTVDNKNILIISAFKDYCGMLFHKGALLKDDSGLLIQQTANVQAARQLRFTSPQQVVDRKTLIKGLICQAVEIERAGLRVELKKTDSFAVAEEFQQRMGANPELKAAFAALTPGRQRAYLLHFSAAKQASTREARIDKCLPLIMSGKGLND